MMKLVYFCGPYRAKTFWETKLNVMYAEQFAGKAIGLTKNIFPVIPHTNTAFWDGLRDGQYFVDGTLTIMQRCDALFVMPGDDGKIAASAGKQGEIAEAQRLGIPIFYTL